MSPSESQRFKQESTEYFLQEIEIPDAEIYFDLIGSSSTAIPVIDVYNQKEYDQLFPYAVISGAKSYYDAVRSGSGATFVYLGNKILENIEDSKERPAFSELDELHGPSEGALKPAYEAFVKFGKNSSQKTLWAILGLEPYSKLRIQTSTIRPMAGGIDFLFDIYENGSGASGQLRDLKEILSKSRTKRENVRVVDGYSGNHESSISIAAFFNNGVWQPVVESMEKGYDNFFNKKSFEYWRAPYSWELTDVQKPELSRQVNRAYNKAIADLEVAKASGDAELLEKSEEIIETIQAYRSKPSHSGGYEARYGEHRGPGGRYRPRLPSGSRPDLPWTNEDCVIVQEMSRQLGCTKKGGEIVVGSKGYPYDLALIPKQNLTLSVTMPNLEINPAYPPELKPREVTDETFANIKGLIENFVVETIVVPGKDFQSGVPVVWEHQGRSYVISGNIRLISFFNSGPAVHARYKDMIEWFMGPVEAGSILVRRLRGLDIYEVEKLIELAHKKPQKNPALLVGNPGIISGVLEAVGLKKRNVPSLASAGDDFVKEHIPGSIPIDEIPSKYKKDPKFSKSMNAAKKEFRDRYGCDPDYAIWVDAPPGSSPVLTAIGELKQVDYIAAEGAKNPAEDHDDYIHWWHEAGERGDGVPYTRAAMLASDPLDGSRVLFVEPKGSKMRFTNRGIVG